jgi:hypothetical protein
MLLVDRASQVGETDEAGLPVPPPAPAPPGPCSVTGLWGVDDDADEAETAFSVDSVGTAPADLEET